MLKKGLSVRKSSRPNYKFLLNANISRKIIPKLSLSVTYNIKHISEISDGSLPDSKIIVIAKKENRVIITHDLDYGEIYYLQEQGMFGVIMLRLKNQSSENVVKRLTDFFNSSEFRNYKLQKSLVIISEDNIRVFTPE